MALDVKYLESVPQTKYLSADNYVNYRAIMRLFFQEHQRMHYQLDKRAILKGLRQDPMLAEYSEQQLNLDLEQLIRWKNLTAIQDPKKVRTVADFQSKQYQYMMSQAALEIERMMVTLENLYTQTSGFSSSALRRIQRALDEIPTLENHSSKEIGEWWQDLQEDFSRLSQSYQDYLREFYGPTAEKYMRSQDFLAYKSHLISYLEEFVQDLQYSSDQIGAQLESIPKEKSDRILELVDQSELEIPRAVSEKKQNYEQELRMKNAGIWQSLMEWFTGVDPTARQVMEVTNEVIRRVVQNAAMLVQMQNMGFSNKAELRHILELFSRSESLEEAHCLSAMVFGAPQERHYVVNRDRDEARIDRSCYDEEPMVFPLRPRERTYRPSVDRSGFTDKTAEKQAQRKKILAQAQQLRAEIRGHIRDGRLEFGKLEKPVSPEARKTFLTWIALANLDPDKRGATEYGQKYTLKYGQGECRMVCTDGELRLPNCVLEFEEGQYV